jgi:hypothetical protein
MPAPDPKKVSKKHLINREPAKYTAIVEGLKRGQGLIQLASEHGIAQATVQKVREDHKDELPSWKRRTVAALSEAGEGIAQSLVEGHENIPWQSKALSLGIILTKIQELTNTMPTKSVMHEHSVTHNSLMDSFKEMKRASQSIDVQSVDETPQIQSK